ncbi:MAG: bifunctional (p)ppGpp synthetase/guanosine-3',5'-bis(diphosphate) 3'-pyrophosphohydrolase [Eggerthellaceae bacterium]|nr:bifunctional (p)ppGpp synthetase/guanosine-3',5'-bis(diphosphate) 3'-pyrophosphohydrolase [Eggerthellaceae bacterium]
MLDQTKLTFQNVPKTLVNISQLDYVEKRYSALKSKVRKYLTLKDVKIIDKAYQFAVCSHSGQKRKSGEPFVVHPLEVAIILADLRMDAETICAALLHDTVEDSDVSLQDITSEFKEKVSYLVDGVTKITQVDLKSLSEKQVVTIRKMFVAMSQDIRVIVIKLADRLNNMRTLNSLPEDRRIFKSQETMGIYAPIAARLGINSIKWELEDLSFFFLQPNKYKQVAQMVYETRSERECYLSEVIDIIKKEMRSLKIKCKIEGRPKHLYSIYNKMSKQGKCFSEIYDLIAVRIICNDDSSCYTALGAVHTLWTPMPGRFKDYIASPKENIYQSLHTTVIGPKGRPLEIQIRTIEMHNTSEYGVAAHWRYKSGYKNAGKVDKELETQLNWLREVVDWQDETNDSQEFLRNLKIDLSSREVFVFTPKGEIVSMRYGATPLDFAYSIHTEVGNHTVAAKVNSKIVPLSYELKQGDRVEIVTQKSARPSRDWLNIVKTPRASSKIKSYFSRISKSDDRQHGLYILSENIKTKGIKLSKVKLYKILHKTAESLGHNNTDSMLVSLAKGHEVPEHVSTRLLKLLNEEGEREDPSAIISEISTSTGRMAPMVTSVSIPKHHEAHTDSGVIVKGTDNVLVKLAGCCKPVHGDKIIGFITRGSGVSIHRKNCLNIKALQKSDADRVIEASWDDNITKPFSYKALIIVEATDRPNLIRDITAALSTLGCNLAGIYAKADEEVLISLNLEIEISGSKFIKIIIEKLLDVPGVIHVRRQSEEEIQ